MDFLNAVLAEEVVTIAELEYSKNEHLGTTELDRKVVFDIYCKTASGQRIIIEMQKFFQAFFKERSLFYTSFAIQEQAKQGDWDFSLCPVYCISLLDFVLKDVDISKEQYLHRVKLIETSSQKVFNDKLSFIYIEIPKFDKNLDELGTNIEKWLYLLTRLEFLERLPHNLQSKIFEKVMGIAELLKLEKTDRLAYEESLKKHRDLKNAMHSQYQLGKEEGREEGREKGLLTTAINMHKEGFGIEIIAKVTGLDIDQLNKILN